jgi:carbonic anhydrase
MDRIRRGVRNFRTKVFSEYRDLYESLAEKQKPDALFLTCGDSRIDAEVITGSQPGQLFVERTPGNIVPIHDDGARVGVSASIEYATAVLGVDDIIVCGHSTCGAMKALLHPETLEAIPATARWLTFAAPAIDELNLNHKELLDDPLAALCRINVVVQMSHLRSHPAVARRIQAGNLGIHGWYYEIHTGRIEAYDADSGSFKLWPE